MILASCFGPGCVLLPQHVKGPPEPPAPQGGVCQVVTTWNPRVAMSPDPTRNGTPMPGLVGRVYLFGSEVDVPRVGDGPIHVTVTDETPRNGVVMPVVLEEWNLDAVTLKRLLRRDMVGWGYTLFLPWGSYRPDITSVRIAVAYQPAGGTPIYATPSPCKLEPPDQPMAAGGMAAALMATK